MKKLILDEEIFLEGKNLQQTLDRYREKFKRATDDEISDKEADRIMMQVIADDPTYQAEGTTTGDYGIWLLNQELKGNIDKFSRFTHFESSITDLLNDFIEKKSNLANKDINSYKSPEELYRVLSEVQLTDRQRERKLRKNVSGAKHVGSTANFDIYIPETYEASCALGKGSGWCTADSRTRQYFDYYKDRYGGNYYIVISKDGKWKYQIHFESNQFSAAGTNPDINTPNDEEMIGLKDIIDKWPELKDALNKVKSDSDHDAAISIRNIFEDKLEFDNEIVLKLSLDEIKKFIRVSENIEQWFIQDVNEIPFMRAFIALQNNKDVFNQWLKTFRRYDKNSLLDSNEMQNCTEKAFRFKLLRRIQQLKAYANTEYLEGTHLAFSLFNSNRFLFRLQLIDLSKDIIDSGEGYYFKQLVRDRKFDEIESYLRKQFPDDDEEKLNLGVLIFSANRLSNSLVHLPSMCKAYFSNESTLQFFFENLEDEIMDAADEKRFSQKYKED